jgi:hypothetical protein
VCEVAVVPNDRVADFVEGMGLEAGTNKPVLRKTTVQLTRTLQGRIQHYIDWGHMPGVRWPGKEAVPRIFRSKGEKGKGAGCINFRAYEMSALVRVMPLACHGVDDRLEELWVSFANYYMEVNRYSKAPGHCSRTLDKCDKLMGDVVAMLTTHFAKCSKNGHNFPKAHMHYHIRAGVLLCGTLRWASCELGESVLKQVKRAFLRTNKQTKTYLLHSANRLSLFAVRYRLNAKRGISAQPAGMGKKRTAYVRARELTENRGAAVNVLSKTIGHRAEPAGFADSIPTRLSLSPQRRAALQSKLEAVISSDHPTCSTVALIHSGVICGRPAFLPPTAQADTVAFWTVYDDLTEKWGRRRPSAVACRGVDRLNQECEWVGHIRVMLRLLDDSGAMLGEYAFMSFVVRDESFERPTGAPHGAVHKYDLFNADAGRCAFLKKEVGPGGAEVCELVPFSDVLRPEYLLPYTRDLQWNGGDGMAVAAPAPIVHAAPSKRRRDSESDDADDFSEDEVDAAADDDPQGSDSEWDADTDEPRRRPADQPSRPLRSRETTNLHTFVLNDIVEVKFDGVWYRGRVVEVDAKQGVDVEFDDGSANSWVPPSAMTGRVPLIKLITPAPHAPEQQHAPHSLRRSFHNKKGAYILPGRMFTSHEDTYMVGEFTVNGSDISFVFEDGEAWDGARERGSLPALTVELAKEMRSLYEETEAAEAEQPGGLNDPHAGAEPTQWVRTSFAWGQWMRDDGPCPVTMHPRSGGGAAADG